MLNHEIKSNAPLQEMTVTLSRLASETLVAIWTAAQVVAVAQGVVNGSQYKTRRNNLKRAHQNFSPEDQYIEDICKWIPKLQSFDKKVMIEKQANFEKAKKQTQTGTSVLKVIKPNNMSQKRRSLSTSDDLRHDLQVQQFFNANVDSLRRDLLNDMRTEFRTDMKETLKETFEELMQTQISTLQKTNQELVASNNSVVATVNNLSKQNGEILRDMKEMKTSVEQLKTATDSNSAAIEIS